MLYGIFGKIIECINKCFIIHAKTIALAFTKEHVFSMRLAIENP